MSETAEMQGGDDAIEVVRLQMMAVLSMDDPVAIAKHLGQISDKYDGHVPGTKNESGLDEVYEYQLPFVVPEVLKVADEVGAAAVDAFARASDELEIEILLSFGDYEESGDRRLYRFGSREREATLGRILTGLKENPVILGVEVEEVVVAEPELQIDLEPELELELEPEPEPDQTVEVKILAPETETVETEDLAEDATTKPSIFEEVVPPPRQPQKRAKRGGRKPTNTERGSARADGDRRSTDFDLTRQYLREIGQHPLLTKDDEIELSQLVEAGLDAAQQIQDDAGDLSLATKRELNRIIKAGEVAQRRFVQSNLRLVVSIAKKYQASGLPLLDLVQEGNLGLMHAVEMFDWRKGFKFSTYATWWIRQAVTRGIANTGRTVRLPVHAGDTLNRVQKARSEFFNKNSRHPTIAELALEVDVEIERVIEALSWAAEPLSLDEPHGPEDKSFLGDFIADRDAEDPAEAAIVSGRQVAVSDMFRSLTPQEKEILKRRFGLDDGHPETLEQVGERYGVTRERIRQIEARAMSKIRHPTSGVGRDIL